MDMLLNMAADAAAGIDKYGTESAWIMAQAVANADAFGYVVCHCCKTRMDADKVHHADVWPPRAYCDACSGDCSQMTEELCDYCAAVRFESD